MVVHVSLFLFFPTSLYVFAVFCDKRTKKQNYIKYTKTYFEENVNMKGEIYKYQGIYQLCDKTCFIQIATKIFSS